MGSHRAGGAAPHRYHGRRVAARTRPRYGRIAAVIGAFVVTGVAVAGGAGLFGTGNARPAAADEGATSQIGLAAESLPATDPGGAAAAGAQVEVKGRLAKPAATSDPVPTDTSPALPTDSGQGRRIVFDQSDQRVWLVDADGGVDRTYLVSGSLTDNLAPGTYSVFSKSSWAVGVDDSGTMRYFVRFAHGANASIGFHSIPVKDGAPLQTTRQLGTPQSHGCIRQDLPDAIALWDFAPVGTEVVVTA